MIVTQSIHKPGADLTADPIGDHLIWVFVSSRAAYGNADPTAMDGQSIRTSLLGLMRTWHPVLRQLVEDSDAPRIAAVPVLTSIPVGRWTPTNVTLLGDAIHTMTPLLGLGGSTALRDAGLLCRRLTEVAQGRPVPAAVGDYEGAMVDYGFRAVRRSAQFGGFVVSDNPLLRTSFRAALRVATRIPALARRMFRPTNW